MVLQIGKFWELQEMIQGGIWFAEWSYPPPLLDLCWQIRIPSDHLWRGRRWMLHSSCLAYLLLFMYASYRRFFPRKSPVRNKERSLVCSAKFTNWRSRVSFFPFFHSQISVLVVNEPQTLRPYELSLTWWGFQCVFLEWIHQQSFCFSGCCLW